MAKLNGVDAEQPKKSEGNEEPIFTDNQKLLLDAYQKANGNFSQAAKNCGMRRETFYSNMNAHPHFEKAIRAIDEEILNEKKAKLEQMLDFAEDELFFRIKGQYTLKPKYDPKTGKAIPGEYELDENGVPIRVYHSQPSERLLIAFLEMKGKDRGYTKRTEHEIKGDMFTGMKINIVNKKPRGK